MRLQLSPEAVVSGRPRKLILETAACLPELDGSDIAVTFKPCLTAHRGRLLSGVPRRGVAVYAAAFIRKRQIVLEDALLAKGGDLRTILIHEIFHFVWVRLGNGARRKFAAGLSEEIRKHARGELGESAAVKKEALRARGSWRAKDQLWRDYVCESFCDTAAWFYSGHDRASEFKLAKRWRDARADWFRSTFAKLHAC